MAPVGPIKPWGPVGPVAPVGPVKPWDPVGPVAPAGIEKSNITFSLVPELVTLAAVPGAVVVVVPTVIVAGPWGPVGPVGPGTFLPPQQQPMGLNWLSHSIRSIAFLYISSFIFLPPTISYDVEKSELMKFHQFTNNIKDSKIRSLFFH